MLGSLVWYSSAKSAGATLKPAAVIVPVAVTFPAASTEKILAPVDEAISTKSAAGANALPFTESVPSTTIELDAVKELAVNDPLVVNAPVSAKVNKFCPH